MKFRIEVQGEEVLRKRLNSLSDKTEDLTDVFTDVFDWFKRRELEQFRTEGAAGSGKWKDLSPAYAAVKEKRYPFQPINRATTRLFRSLAFETEDTVKDIKTRSATFGTKVPYARLVQNVRPVIDMTEKDAKEIAKIFKRKLGGFVRGEGFVMTEANYLDFG